MKSSLPIGWEATSISTAFMVNPGHTGIDISDDTDVSFVPMPEIEEETGRLNPTISRPYREVKKGYTKFIDGDVLFAKITPCMENGKVAVASGLLNGVGCGTTEVFVFREKGICDAKYLFYYLVQRRFRQYAKSKFNGAVGHLRVPSITFDEPTFPLPPLAEQRRIVAQLEATMQKLEASQERLEKLPVLLKKFRQAVLAAAVSGKLTEAWRRETKVSEGAAALIKRVEEAIDENYREQCIAAIASGKRKPKDHRKNKKSIQQDGELASIPDTWIYARLEDLSYQITDGAHHTPTYIEKGVKFLSVKNIRPFSIDASQTRFISTEQHAELCSRCYPERGDILYTKIGSVGYAAVNNLDEDFSLFVSVALIKPVKEHISNRYLEIALNSETTLNQAKSRVKGIGTPDLHLVEIRDFKIGIPPAEEQQEIVRQVNHYFELADQLEARFEQAAAMVEQLPQALLAKAFSGQLVPQDPNDEPASTLLERLGSGTPAPVKSKRGQKSKAVAGASLFD